MTTRKIRLGLYRGLYWANQGLLQAVRALEEVKAEPSDPLDDSLRRAQAMLEETRALMNRILAEWIERRE